jgi:hypothetical protein
MSAATHPGGLAAPLLAKLEGVRPAGPGRWYARCPAHDDKSPSLSVRETGDKVLLHCWTGCTADEVLAALGLAWSALYPDRWDCAKARPNEGAARSAKRILDGADPLEFERKVLLVAAADLEAGRELSAEDRARVELALERIDAAKGSAAA